METKNLICIPYAYISDFVSGNATGNELEKIKVYLKNACVALVSAKHYNPNAIVVLATNLEEEKIDGEFTTLLRKNNIGIFYIPYDSFKFSKDYTWSLAFYKLCVLSHLCKMDFDNFCYMDADVYIQSNMDSIWEECKQHIMLYDTSHGLDIPSYVRFIDEIEKFTGKRLYITHWGGEFVALSKENVNILCDECKKIYEEMLKTEFKSEVGDEFILSLAANNIKPIIKNAGAYIQRLSTYEQFYCISTRYKYDRLAILHLPAEKNTGMIQMYNRYIKNSIVPKDRIVWKIFGLSRRKCMTKFKMLIQN